MSNINESETLVGSFASKPILDSVKQKNTKKRNGLQFPFSSTNAGYFSKMSDVEVIRSNLIQLIKTEPGERVMLPDFGCPLKSLLFAPITRETIVEARERITESVRNYLPTVRLLSIRVAPIEEYRSNGLPSLKILLVCKIVDRADSIFEVKVTL